MNVQDLIDLLNKFPADMPVHYSAGMFGGDLKTDCIYEFMQLDGEIVVLFDLDK